MGSQDLDGGAVASSARARCLPAPLLGHAAALLVLQRPWFLRGSTPRWLPVRFPRARPWRAASAVDGAWAAAASSGCGGAPPSRCSPSAPSAVERRDPVPRCSDRDGG